MQELWGGSCHHWFTLRPTHFPIARQKHLHKRVHVLIILSGYFSLFTVTIHLGCSDHEDHVGPWFFFFCSVFKPVGSWSAAWSWFIHVHNHQIRSNLKYSVDIVNIKIILCIYLQYLYFVCDLNLLCKVPWWPLLSLSKDELKPILQWW